MLPERLSRRGLLGLAALGAAEALRTLGWDLARAEAGVGGVASGAVTCVPAPELTEGPYYLPNERVRRDITEGKPGTPLRLRLMVVSTSSCRPIKGAAVDIWHADASGVYSGV